MINIKYSNKSCSSTNFVVNIKYGENRRTYLKKKKILRKVKKYTLETTCDENRVIPQNLPRRMAMSSFRIASGHDYMKKHLKKGICYSLVCPLSGETEQTMEQLKDSSKWSNLPSQQIHKRLS